MNKMSMKLLCLALSGGLVCAPTNQRGPVSVAEPDPEMSVYGSFAPAAGYSPQLGQAGQQMYMLTQMMSIMQDLQSKQRKMEREMREMRKELNPSRPSSRETSAQTSTTRSSEPEGSLEQNSVQQPRRVLSRESLRQHQAQFEQNTRARSKPRYSTTPDLERMMAQMMENNAKRDEEMRMRDQEQAKTLENMRKEIDALRKAAIRREEELENRISGLDHESVSQEELIDDLSNYDGSPRSDSSRRSQSNFFIPSRRSESPRRIAVDPTLPHNFLVRQMREEMDAVRKESALREQELKNLIKNLENRNLEQQRMVEKLISNASSRSRSEPARATYSLMVVSQRSKSDDPISKYSSLLSSYKSLSGKERIEEARRAFRLLPSEFRNTPLQDQHPEVQSLIRASQLLCGIRSKSEEPAKPTVQANLPAQRSQSEPTHELRGGMLRRIDRRDLENESAGAIASRLAMAEWDNR